jgi:hypothetical protein
LFRRVLHYNYSPSSRPRGVATPLAVQTCQKQPLLVTLIPKSPLPSPD